MSTKPDQAQEPINIKPMRITIDGKLQPLIFDAREITAIRTAASALQKS
jgi:hypothetical protein